MGVPKFYRWLSERYPLINQILSDSSLLPEFDNLYLDMNGIIHACTHPNDDDTASSLTMREMMLGIFRYIDRCVTEIVKPKKLLYLAIDGVAPRAKLNQQRSRRFRAAQERLERITRAKQKGIVVDEESMFDSNCITPGTEFMGVVSKHLKWFIQKKIHDDPLWKNLEVIFSGHDVPGEGEHKIMQHIREMRSKPGYQPNQRHCMYGQDADLIMLALATHEPHFTLLREIINFNTGAPRGKLNARQTVIKQTKEAQFQLLHISILREYLFLEFAYDESNIIYDRERIVDDFILLTFLVGNDFLPHLPTLDIGEEAFGIIYDAYKTMQRNRFLSSLKSSDSTVNPLENQTVSTTSDKTSASSKVAPSSMQPQQQKEAIYLVENGEIHDVQALEDLFTIIGQQENDILQHRELEQKQFNQRRRKYADANVPTEEELEGVEVAFQRAYEEALGISEEELYTIGSTASIFNGGETDETETETETAVLSASMAAIDLTKGDESTEKVTSGGSDDQGVEQSDVEIEKSIKDYRGRYYFEKFKIIPSTTSATTFMRELMTHYLEGLIWVFAYYSKGCISWTWYYPYHYGPMLQDMKNLRSLVTDISFNLGTPFLPFQQLLGCLPPLSKSLLPKKYQWVMTSSESPIKEFYPDDFEIDMAGKRNPWEAVVKLPFIDEGRLKEAEATHCNKKELSVEECQRNEFGQICIFTFDPTNLKTVFSCNPAIGLPDIPNAQSRVTFQDMDIHPIGAFVSKLIEGTKLPYPGFPSLGVLPLSGVEWIRTKLNVFGSESKYTNLVLNLDISQQNIIKDLPATQLLKLLGKSVYVNYPLCHETQVVAITSELGEIRLKQEKNSNTIEQIPYNEEMKTRWIRESEREAKFYLCGRGVPGTGGLNIGDIQMRLRVRPLQGMKRNLATGARQKVFGKVEADVPICMALWSSPTVDPRFQELDEVPLHKLLPYDSTVVAIDGPYKGCVGKVKGPHGPSDSTGSRSRSSMDGSKDRQKSRVVTVEFEEFPPEIPFGYTIAASIQDSYHSSREIAEALSISPSVLGRIVGSVVIEPGRHDVGLDLKRNGEYQLLGYVRRVVKDSGDRQNHKSNLITNPWKRNDIVQIIGSSTSVEYEQNSGASGDNSESVFWEYSTKTLALIADYRSRFPELFQCLNTYSNKYRAEDIGGVKVVEEIEEWLKSQPYFKMPRTPFSTISMSRDAIAAVERAADVRTAQISALRSRETTPLPVKRCEYKAEHLYSDSQHTPTDLSILATNSDGESSPSGSSSLPPQLGDRVVNITGVGIPFALRGTVIAIHLNTGHVEVLFDEEFIGGKSLQGTCSQFRGRLVPWDSVLRVSDPSTLSKVNSVKGGGKELKTESAHTNRPENTHPLPHPHKIHQPHINTHLPHPTTHSHENIASHHHTTPATLATDAKPVKTLNVASIDDSKKQPEKPKAVNATSILKKSLNISQSTPKTTGEPSVSTEKLSHVEKIAAPQKPILDVSTKQAQLLSLLGRSHKPHTPSSHPTHPVPPHTHISHPAIPHERGSHNASQHNHHHNSSHNKSETDGPVKTQEEHSEQSQVKTGTMTTFPIHFMKADGVVSHTKVGQIAGSEGTGEDRKGVSPVSSAAIRLLMKKIAPSEDHPVGSNTPQSGRNQVSTATAMEGGKAESNKEDTGTGQDSSSTPTDSSSSSRKASLVPSIVLRKKK